MRGLLEVAVGHVESAEAHAGLCETDRGGQPSRLVAAGAGVVHEAFGESETFRGLLEQGVKHGVSAVERQGEGRSVAQFLGQSECLGAGLERLRADAGIAGVFRGPGCQQRCPDSRVGGAAHRQGGLDAGHPLVVDRGGVGKPAPTVGEYGRNDPVAVHQPVGERGRLEESLAVLGVPRPGLRRAQVDEQVAPQPGIVHMQVQCVSQQV